MLWERIPSAPFLALFTLPASSKLVAEAPSRAQQISQNRPKRFLAVWTYLSSKVRQALCAVRIAAMASRDEVEAILKIVDPDGWISMDRVIYEVISPEESVLKKV